MSDQFDLFAPQRASTPISADQRASTPRGAFDPYSHPCAVCGAANAPFGEGWSREPQFFCRGHREEERRAIFAGDADRGS
jgi:hypothetical protein